MNQGAFHIIQEKLDRFLRKYYWHQILRGLVLSSSVLCLFFISIVLLEYFGRLGKTGRSVLFFSLLGTMGYLGIRHVAWPLSKFFKIGKTLPETQIADIVGNHFKAINDKLLNTIQLQQSGAQNALIEASIAQKTEELKPFNFSKAIEYNDVIRLIKFSGIPLGLLLAIGLYNPAVISESTHRIVNFNSDFIPQNPYQFELNNGAKLSCLRNESFPLTVSFTGDKVPSELYFEQNGKLYRFSKKGLNQFEYQIGNVQNDIDFKIKMGAHYSGEYQLNVLDKASLLDYQIAMEYPKYLGKENSIQQNNGNITVPEGTKLKWLFKTAHSNKITFAVDSNVLNLKTNAHNQTKHELVAKQNFNYKIRCFNNDGLVGDEFNFSVNVVKDEYPEIKVATSKDSLHPYLVYFEGKISDDYGFSKLNFHFENKDTTGVINLGLQNANLIQSFRHYLDLSNFKHLKSPSLSFHFTVWDNDAVNGAKSTKSGSLTFQFPSEDGIDSLLNNNAKQLKEQLAKNMQDAQELQNEFSAIKKLMLEKKKLDWNDKSKIEQFLNKQKELEQNIMRLNQDNEKNNFQKEQLSPEEERILEKQERINELFEQLMDEETKKLYDELEKLLEKMDKEKTEDKLEEINMKNEELEKELDRTLELFKQMEFEEKLEKTVEKLDELSKKQEELAKETKENKTKSNEDLKKQQEELEKEFNKVQEDLKDLQKKNEELENKKNFDGMEQEQKSVQEQMKNSKEQLGNNKRKKSSKSQKNAAQQMQQMAQQLQKMQEQMQQEQQSEDLNGLRQVLENLVSLSTEQEDLFKTFKKTNRYDPRYPDLTKVQGKLKDNAKLIEDSLTALGKRQMMLKSIINKEILELNHNMDKSINDLRERRSYSAVVHQQRVMTSANNLALLLDESIQQMQNAMKSQKFGAGSCSKPGGSNPKDGMKNMKSLQKMLNDQIKKMKKEMEGNGSNPGKKGQKGKKGMAKSFGKMAAEQSAIRQKLDELSKQLKNDQKGKNGLGGQLDNLKKQMEETEKDLLQKNITPETIMRQEQIMTRLLEAEKSIREREFDKKRESKEGKSKFERNLSDFLEYKSIDKKGEDLLKNVPPSLNLFYKRKVNEYFNTFGE